MISLNVAECEALIGLLNVRLSQIHSHKHPWTLANEKEAVLLGDILTKLEQRATSTHE